MATKLAAPFGAKCLVRVKALHVCCKGEIAERWISGRYAGLSPTVNEGHLVYRDDGDGKGNGFRLLSLLNALNSLRASLSPVRRSHCRKVPAQKQS